MLKEVVKVNIKNMFLMIFIFSLAIMIIPEVDASPFDNARLDVVLQSYEPYPASPNSYVTLKFRATNTGTRTAPDVAFELDPSYPFSLDPNQNSKRSFGSLSPGSSVVFEYRVRVDEGAVLGTNDLLLRSATDGSNWINKEFSILVRLTESVLSINSVSTEPEVMNPGKISRVNIELVNSGATALRDISVRLNFHAQSEMGVLDLPFSPVESTAEKRLRLLSGRSSEELSFNIMTYPDADSKIYRVPITVSYTDETGNVNTKHDVIGLIVGSEPVVRASISDVSLNPARTKLTLRFVNRGTTDLKFFNVLLDESNEFDLLSTSNEYYIGRLSSDDFDMADFVISFSPETEVINLPIKLEYLDANNNEYIEDINLELDLASIRRLHSSNGNGGGTIFFVVIIVVIGGFLLHRRNKKKKNRK